jgi:WD40 repeat protein
MTLLRRLLPVLLPLAVLWGAPAPLRAAPAGDDKKSAEAADPLPEGARLRLGTGHFRHPAVVSRIYALPDGKRLLTFAQDAKARVWDIATEKQLVEMALAPQPYIGLVFSVSHDGKTLASANALDRTIRIWTLADGKEAIAFGGLPPNQGFLDLEYSADGKQLVSSHQDRTYRVWDPATAKEVRQVSHPAKVNPGVVQPAFGRVNFTPDAKGLTIFEDWAVRVLDAEDGKEVRWFGGHVAPVVSYAFSPDGKRMASVATDRAARLWDLASGKTVGKLPLPLGGGREVAFTANGKTLAVACNDHTIRLFDVEAAKEVSHLDLTKIGSGLTLMALSNDGKTVFCNNGESVLHGFDVATGKDLYPATGHAGPVAAFTWSPEGKRLVTCGSGGDRSIVVWDAANGKVLHQLPPLEGYYYTSHVQFGADGKTLLSYGNDRTVRAWDAGEGKELNSFVTSPVQPQSFAFSPDGKLAAVACADRTVRVWDVAAEKELHLLEMKPAGGPNNYFYGNVSFAGDGRTLSVYSTNERLTRRWDALTGKEMGEVKGVNPPIPLAGQPGHSADGRCVTVLQGATVNLTELATGKVRQAFTLQQPAPPPAGAPGRQFLNALGAAVSQDGRTVAALASDGSLHFWDSGTGKALAERKGLTPNTRLAAFSPDGKTLATGGTDGGALLWDVPGPDAEGRLAVKDLTAEAAAELWKDVSGEDAARAWQAVLTLAASPKGAVPFVQKQLKPGAAPDAKQVAKWIADLDSEQFQEREDATEALVRAGKESEAAVKKALENKPSAEAKQRLEFVLSKMNGNLGPNMEDVRATRAVEVLEKIGTPEARKALEEVAKGAEGHLSAEARSALERLKGR